MLLTSRSEGLPVALIEAAVRKNQTLPSYWLARTRPRSSGTYCTAFWMPLVRAEGGVPAMAGCETAQVPGLTISTCTELPALYRTK